MKRSGVQKRIIEALQESGESTLWSMNEILNEVGGGKHALENNLQTIRIEGRITRHIDRHEDGSLQFAIKIPSKDTDVYIKQNRAKSVSNGLATVKKKKKKKNGITMTPKGIRMMFATLHNDLSRIEDEVLTALEQADEIQSVMAKMQNIMS